MGTCKTSEINATAYAFYKLPNAEVVTQIFQSTPPNIVKDLSDLTHSTQGFVIAPFDCGENDTLLIVAEHIKQIALADFPKHFSPCCQQGAKPLNFENEDRNTYEHHFHNCHALLQSGAINKIVLSHTKQIAIENSINSERIFIHACQKHPNCYIALWHTPQTGTWLTITPEVLLEKTADNAYHTVALAGTMPLSDGSETAHWSDKNIAEQTYVADYIDTELRKLGVSPSRAELKTIQANHLQHLCTDFHFTTNVALGTLLKQLHPTPAVCGTPKQTTLQAISAIETHKRKYYAGFSGPINLIGETNCYVTLRCAQWNEPTSINLYAGGGLIIDSQLKDEWAEVKSKMQTAYSAVCQ